MSVPLVCTAAGGFREGLVFEKPGAEIIKLLSLGSNRTRRRFLTPRPLGLAFGRTLSLPFGWTVGLPFGRSFGRSFGPAAFRAVITTSVRRASRTPRTPSALRRSVTPSGSFAAA